MSGSSRSVRHHRCGFAECRIVGSICPRTFLAWLKILTRGVFDDPHLSLKKSGPRELVLPSRSLLGTNKGCARHCRVVCPSLRPDPHAIGARKRPPRRRSRSYDSAEYSKLLSAAPRLARPLRRRRSVLGLAGWFESSSHLLSQCRAPPSSLLLPASEHVGG